MGLNILKKYYGKYACIIMILLGSFIFLACGMSEDERLRENLNIFASQLKHNYSEIGMTSEMTQLAYGFYMVTPTSTFTDRKGRKFEIHHRALINPTLIYEDGFWTTKTYSINEVPTDIEDALAIKIESDDHAVCFPYISKKAYSNDYFDSIIMFTANGQISSPSGTVLKKIGIAAAGILLRGLTDGESVEIAGDLASELDEKHKGLKIWTISSPNLKKIKATLEKF